MPKAKGKKKGKGKRKEIDWAADLIFDKNRAMIYIEHTEECPIYQTKAEEFQQFLQREIPDRIFQLIRNGNGKVPPRPGAFEIGFAQTARTSVHNIWSGIEKGPPRRDKFPLSYAMLLPEVRAILKKIYFDLNAQQDDQDEDYDEQYGGDATVNIDRNGAGREETA